MHPGQVLLAVSVHCLSGAALPRGVVQDVQGEIGCSDRCLEVGACKSGISPQDDALRRGVFCNALRGDAPGLRHLGASRQSKGARIHKFLIGVVAGIPGQLHRSRSDALDSVRHYSICRGCEYPAGVRTVDTTASCLRRPSFLVCLVICSLNGQTDYM